MKKRIQTTTCFNSEESAEHFKKWLILYGSDTDYGVPLFVSMTKLGWEWMIEYSTNNPDLLRGIIIGIKLKGS